MSQQKILLLENVAAQAAGVRERLALAGFQVAVGRYEADGLKKLAAWAPDVVLLSTAHPAGSLVEYCARVRALAPAARIILTSSLNRERLLQESPGLAGLVDDVLLRPYSFDEVMELMRGVPRGGSPAPVAPKVVAVVDRDPGTLQEISRVVGPPAFEVVELSIERVGAFCRERHPAVLVLEWPLTKEFISGTLTELRSVPGEARLPVLLISGAARDAVSAAASELMPLVDMFFRKPVAWQHFFRVLARILDVPSLGETGTEPPSAPAPPPAGEEDVRQRFQDQLEAKFLEVEELRRRLEAAERQSADPGLAAELARLREENAGLRASAADGEKKAELRCAMETLKVSELEVKLDNLLRMKDEFERRAQDMIEEHDAQEEQLRQDCAALRAGAEDGARERDDLRRERERLLIEKELLEERLQGRVSPPGQGEPAEPGRSEGTQPPAGQEAAGRDAQNPLPEETTEGEGDLRSSAARDEEALRELRERVEELESRTAELAAERRVWEEKARAQEEARSVAAAAVADLTGKLAAANEELGRERELCEQAAARSAQEERDWQEKVERLEEHAADLAAQRAAGEEVRSAAAAETAEVEVRARLQAQLGESEAALAAVSAEREALRVRGAEREANLTAEVRAWRERAEAAAAEAESLRAQEEERGRREVEERHGLQERLEGAERERSELQARVAAEVERTAAAGRAALAEKELEVQTMLRERDALRVRFEQAEATLTAAADALRSRCAELEASLTAEVSAWREKAAAAVAEADRLRAHAEEVERREREERKTVAERIAAAERGLRESEARAASERERMVAERRTAFEEQDARVREALRERDDLQASLGCAEDSLATEREAARSREEALQAALEVARGRARTLEEQAADLARGSGAVAGVQEELRRLQAMMEEVVTRARTEVVEFARREAALEARLQAAGEERRLLQERCDRSLAEAAERERRASFLLESALRRATEEAPPLRQTERENLPAIIPVPEEPPPGRPRPRRRRAVVLGATAALLALCLVGAFAWYRSSTPRPAVPRLPATREPGPRQTPGGREGLPAAGLGASGEVFERWTRRDLSGGVLLQVTLRSEEELRAEVEGERRLQGWTDRQAELALARLLEKYRFDEHYYFHVYLKNLQPGYPSYLNEIYARLFLRDDQGNEVRAFFPEGHERDRTVYSIGDADAKRNRDESFYEVTVPAAFPRRGLASDPAYLQLLVYDVGTASRRVLTWELE